MSEGGMKLIIAGGRDYQITKSDFGVLDEFASLWGVTEVVSGGARGADAGGEEWAKLRGIPIRRFFADWGLHGRSAGPKRNQQMADYADALFLFPGGKGSADMERRVKANGLPVYKLL